MSTTIRTGVLAALAVAGLTAGAALTAAPAGAAPKAAPRFLTASQLPPHPSGWTAGPVTDGVPVELEYCFGEALLAYDIRHRDARDGTRLWETVREGMPRQIKVRNEPFGLGTGVLRSSGGLHRPSGLLRPGL